MRAPDFWDRKTDGLLPTVLRPLGCLMAGLTALRVKSAKPYRAPVPVICVGNLVAGGAGKTPVALDLAQRLTAKGHSPHVVSRGYGGKELGPLQVEPDRHTALDVGDEPLLLARATPTWVSRERPDPTLPRRIGAQEDEQAWFLQTGEPDESQNDMIAPRPPIRTSILTGIAPFAYALRSPSPPTVVRAPRPDEPSENLLPAAPSQPAASLTQTPPLLD